MYMYMCYLHVCTVSLLSLLSLFYYCLLIAMIQIYRIYMYMYLLDPTCTCTRADLATCTCTCWVLHVVILFFYHHRFEDGSPVPSECAIKIYKTTLNEFFRRDKYIKDDYRFKNRFSKQNPRKIIKMWAEKEMYNLKRWVCKVGVSLVERWVCH